MTLNIERLRFEKINIHENGDMIIDFYDDDRHYKILYKNIEKNIYELYKNYSDIIDDEKFYEKYIKNRYSFEKLN